MDAANKAYYAAYTSLDENAQWTQYYTGAMMKGFCVSAVKVAATVSVAAAAVVATSF